MPEEEDAAEDFFECADRRSLNLEEEAVFCGDAITVDNLCAARAIVDSWPNGYQSGYRRAEAAGRLRHRQWHSRNCCWSDRSTGCRAGRWAGYSFASIVSAAFAATVASQAVPKAAKIRRGRRDLKEPYNICATIAACYEE